MSETVGEFMAQHQDMLLVVQGGGMRGVVSMAVLQAWHQAGIRAEGFGDGIYGTSSGYDNAMHFAIGSQICSEGMPVIDRSVAVYTHDLATPDFIRLGRIATRLFGGRRPAIDIDYLATNVFAHLNPQLDQVLGNHAEVFAGVTNAATGELSFVSSHDRSVSAYDVTRATAALPVVYGRRVQLGPAEYVDGGASRTLPVHEAVTHSRQLGNAANNLCIVGTRAAGHGSEGIPRAVQPIVRWPLMRGESKQLKDMVCSDDPGNYDATMSTLAEIPDLRSLLVWQPSSKRWLVGRMCKDSEALARCARQAKEEALRFLDRPLRKIGGVTVPATVRLAV